MAIRETPTTMEIVHFVKGIFNQLPIGKVCIKSEVRSKSRLCNECMNEKMISSRTCMAIFQENPTGIPTLLHSNNQGIQTKKQDKE